MADRIAIITGAAFGIGRATAAILAQRGYRVLVCDIDVDNGQATAAAIGPAAQFRKLDVAQDADWEKVVAEAKLLGDVQIVVNNAGNPSNRQSIEDATPEEWQRVFQVNALGPLLGCKHGIRAMRATGGAIVNVASVAAVSGLAGLPIYSSSKAAVNGLTLSVAAYCRAQGLPIRCNSVLPGGTRTKMYKDARILTHGIDIEATPDRPEAAALLAGLAEPEDVANVIVFLASAEAKNIQGETIRVDNMRTRMLPSLS